MTTIVDELKYFFKSKSALSIIMLINIIIFLFVNIITLISVGAESILIENMAVPAYLPFLQARAWTVITYMFLQFDFFHIFFNMYMLYLGGKLFVNYLGSKKLIVTYLIGGIFGAIFYVIAFNIFPIFETMLPVSYALGASASVLAIFIAISTYIPNFTFNLLFIGQVKLKHIAILFVIIDVLSISRSNPGGHIAHLGGAFWGFIYIMTLKQKKTSFFNFNGIKKIFNNINKPKKAKMKVKYNGSRPLSDEEYNTQKAKMQKQIDAILDKISKSGYESLSKEEKDILFNMSKK